MLRSVALTAKYSRDNDGRMAKVSTLIRVNLIVIERRWARQEKACKTNGQLMPLGCAGCLFGSAKRVTLAAAAAIRQEGRLIRKEFDPLLFGRPGISKVGVYSEL